MFKAVRILAITVLCVALRVRIENLDDAVAFVSCNAPWITQSKFLGQNQSFWFEPEDFNYSCVVASSRLKFKAWKVDNMTTANDYGWYIQRDGIYIGDVNGQNLQLRYGW